MALLDRATRWWPDEAWRRRIDPLRLSLIAAAGDLATAVKTGEELLADTGLDPSVRRQLEPVHASNLHTFGRAGAAYELSLRIRPQVPLQDATDNLALVVCGMIGVQGGHDWPELDRWLSTLITDGVQADDHGAVGIASLMIAALRFIAGRYRDAARWLAEAEVHLEHHDAYGALLNVHATRVGIAYYTGDAPAAETAIRRCREALAAEPLPSQRPYIARAEAWAAAANADHLQAQQILLDASEAHDDIPVVAAELLYTAMLAAARAGAPGTRLSAIADRLSDLRQRCDAPLVQSYSDHATALAARDGTGLMQTAQDFGTGGQLRYACEAAAHAATVFADAGREDSARRAVVRSEEFHLSSQAGFAPAIPALARGGVGLTARERQLVELAGNGLSNGEIADRLVLSVRTVESHVYRAMQKLGISDRRQLPGRVPD
jgi:ATP/maltotriose-dependent transcriptional regulator MalT